MVQSKTALFEAGLTEKANLFKALAHPARLKILQFLAETKTCITGDISDELPLGRTTVNQHLKELKNIGLLDWHIEGVTTKYCLNFAKVQELNDSLQSFLTEILSENYKCE